MANVQRYVDKRGNPWVFKAQRKNIKEMLTEFGFTIRKDNTNTLNLRCQKKSPAGGICPIKGIYFKSNGYLYIRENEKHEHSEKGVIYWGK
jgi:hypothetical protein